MKYFFWLILSVGFPAFAQQKTIDSLHYLLKKHRHHDTTRVKLFSQIAGRYIFDKPDSSLFFAEKSLELSEKLHYEKGISEAWFALGQAYNTKNEYGKALDYLFKSLPDKEHSPNKDALRNTYNEIGAAYEYQGNFPKALEYFLKALKTAEMANDKFGIGFELGNIGNIYGVNDQHEKALEYYLKALNIAEEINDEDGIAFTSLKSGIIYNHLKKYEQALAGFERAARLYEKTGFSKGIAESLTQTGVTYQKKNDYPKAFEYLQKCLLMSEKLADRQPFAECLQHLSETYLLAGDDVQALFYAEKALTLAQTIGDNDVIYHTEEILSRIYKKQGHFEKALLHYQHSEAVKDSLFNVKRTQTLQSVLTDYEINKQQQEIIAQKAEIEHETLANKFFMTGLISAGLVLGLLGYVIWQTRRKNRLLYEQNQEINLRKEEIDAQNEMLLEINLTKDRLFSIISHDLRSPIAALQGTLYLLQLGVLSAEELEKVSGELTIRVNDTTNLLNNLLYWAKSQMDGIRPQPENIKLQKIISETISLLSPQANVKRIHLETDLPENISVFADYQMFSLILRNLISNAIKFTPTLGKIFIKATSEDKICQISVIDTGVGISEENLQKLFSPLTHFTTQGTSQEMGTGLGLMLCKDFAKRNGGKLLVESQEGKGSTFILKLPLHR